MIDINKVLHVGKLGQEQYLFLIHEAGLFQWKDLEGNLIASGVTLQEAIRKSYKLEGFVPVNCGFRYTLPERDEVGFPALFKQMIASYSTPSGIYFDNESGHLARVDFASDEALSLWKLRV